MTKHINKNRDIIQRCSGRITTNFPRKIDSGSAQCKMNKRITYNIDIVNTPIDTTSLVSMTNLSCYILTSLYLSNWYIL